MKIKNRVSMIGALALALVAPVVMASTTFAWGPDRPTYTNEKPADHATFNSITNNALVGNELDFVRIMEKNSGNEYVSNLTIEPGKQYEVYIYYHNDASETYNDKAHNRVGVAREVRLISDFPKELAKGETGRVLGKITASNTDPLEVWDEAFITASEALTLHYIEGSAKIFNAWNKSGTMLSTRLFSPEGTYLGLAELNGVILGCDQYSGSITYTIQAVANGLPVEPDSEEPTPGEPETPVQPVVPDELPQTGSVEIILAVVVIGLIVAGVIYWRKTNKAVKRTTKKVKGRK